MCGDLTVPWCVPQDDWLGSLQLLTEAFHPGVHVRMDRQSSVIERHNSTYQGDMLNLVFHVAESTSGEVWQGLPLLYHVCAACLRGGCARGRGAACCRSDAVRLRGVAGGEGCG